MTTSPDSPRTGDAEIAQPNALGDDPALGLVARLCAKVRTFRRDWRHEPVPVKLADVPTGVMGLGIVLTVLMMPVLSVVLLVMGDFLGALLCLVMVPMLALCWAFNLAFLAPVWGGSVLSRKIGNRRAWWRWGFLVPQYLTGLAMTLPLIGIFMNDDYEGPQAAVFGLLILACGAGAWVAWFILALSLSGIARLRAHRSPVG